MISSFYFGLKRIKTFLYFLHLLFHFTQSYLSQQGVCELDGHDIVQGALDAFDNPYDFAFAIVNRAATLPFLEIQVSCPEMSPGPSRASTLPSWVL